MIHGLVQDEPVADCSEKDCSEKDCSEHGRLHQPPGPGRGLLAVVAALLGAVVGVVLTSGQRYGRGRRGSVALQWTSRLVLRALGVRVVTSGLPVAGPCLVVANRSSWLDVLVLAAHAPMVPVAQARLGGWPLLGPLARRMGAVFVGGPAAGDLRGDVDEIAQRLRSGHRVLVFPGAVRRCGGALERFRCAPFQAAVDAAVVISPAAVSYRNGPGGRLTATNTWLPAIPAVVSGGHPARDRAMAARRTEYAVARSLGRPVARRSASSDAVTALGSAGPSRRVAAGRWAPKVA